MWNIFSQFWFFPQEKITAETKQKSTTHLLSSVEENCRNELSAFFNIEWSCSEPPLLLCESVPMIPIGRRPNPFDEEIVVRIPTSRVLVSSITKPSERSGVRNGDVIIRLSCESSSGRPKLRCVDGLASSYSGGAIPWLLIILLLKRSEGFSKIKQH